MAKNEKKAHQVCVHGYFYPSNSSAKVNKIISIIFSQTLAFLKNLCYNKGEQRKVRCFL